ncbi:uncharacterized protein LOC132407123 [Hypanus sabinus]|uniref:uncharacterized protein LOC132407123 n=1 Tax=Hypanus sabinus TaxID=79690 RepID=UPI0028C44BE6|nr:uncharacterized protein LOC132407123 [Hypanus sabinus]
MDPAEGQQLTLAVRFVVQIGDKLQAMETILCEVTEAMSQITLCHQAQFHLEEQLKIYNKLLVQVNRKLEIAENRYALTNPLMISRKVFVVKISMCLKNRFTRLSFAMSVDATVWFVALLAAFLPVNATVFNIHNYALSASKGTSAKVDQFPSTLNASIGGNESMFCKFPILQDTAEVSWWKEGQKAFIEPGSRNQFNVRKGRGTFTLLNVTYTDVGWYYCQVKSQQQILGNGSGSQIKVFTPPTPLKIIRVEETSPTSRKLMCITAPFYPKKLDIFWRRNNKEIQSEETAISETSEGSFEASSTLEDTQPAQGKVVYTCLVNHETLKHPAIFSYIIEQDRENSSKPLILGGALGGLAFIILIIILIITGVKAKRGKNMNDLTNIPMYYLSRLKRQMVMKESRFPRHYPIHIRHY